MKPIRTLFPILILALLLNACGGPKLAEPSQIKPNQPEPTQPKAASPTATSAQPETVSAGTFNLKDLAAGQSIHVSQLTFPAGVKPVVHGDDGVVALIQVKRGSGEAAAEGEAATA